MLHHAGDRAFDAYFTRPAYLDMVTRAFGPETAAHVREMTGHQLERRHAALASPAPAEVRT